jgi:hypothetical protein
MALGVYGTTLLDELNRLANGGTYRTPDQMVDEARLQDSGLCKDPSQPIIQIPLVS